MFANFLFYKKTVLFLVYFNLVTIKLKIMGLLYALLIGAVAGWLGGYLMKGGGFGILVNIIIGIIGGLVGNWVLGALEISIGTGILSDIATGAIGAVIILFIAGLLKK
jgi:uncharacterized membrane protein YeaQ/YmgE (transglycosylase-associated protein family)